jgi:hypothetical protein
MRSLKFHKKEDPKSKNVIRDDHQHQLEEGAFHGSRSGPSDEGLFLKDCD